MTTDETSWCRPAAEHNACVFVTCKGRESRIEMQEVHKTSRINVNVRHEICPHCMITVALSQLEVVIAAPQTFGIDHQLAPE